MTAPSTATSGNSRGSAFALGGLLTLVLGCCVAAGVLAVLRQEGTPRAAESQGAAADGPRAEPASIDGPFRYVAVRRTREERPARFDAALPAGPQAFADGRTDAHPPPRHVRDGLCAGDRAMGERWLAAIAAGSAEGSPSDSRAYTQLFGECASEDLCSWVGEVLRSDRPANVLRPVWSLAARCDDPASGELFLDRAVPAEAYIAWTEYQIVWDVRGGRLPPYVDVAKLAAAVEVIAAGEEAVPEGVPLNPALLGMVDDSRAAAALLRMHAATRDSARRQELAMAMHNQHDRRARRIFEAACAIPRQNHPFCTAPAASILVAPPEPAPAVVPVAPAAFSRLRALDLLGTRKPGGAVAGTTIELLEQSGRARRFERGSDEYDSTARMLAVLATPVLDDVVFYEEVDAADDEAFDPDSDVVEGHVITAWSGGERFETSIAPELEWENLETVVGLLNVLTRARGSSVRFVLDDSDGTAEVVAGLERSLRAAIAEGLIHVWTIAPPTTAAPGEAFLRALRGESVD